MAGRGIVEFIPFAPSARFYAQRFRHMSALKIEPRNIARTKIKKTDGNLLTLSIPLEGGAGILKNPKNLFSISMSDHGNWRHVHLGALEAAYGKTPFYIHFMPSLREVYGNEVLNLYQFTSAIDKAILSFIFKGEEPLFSVPPSFYVNPNKERCRELAHAINPELSIIDALMRLGPETFQGLLALDN